MFDALGLLCMIWWCPMVLHPSHADIQCMAAEAQESPLRNVKINWRRIELTWESSRDFAQYQCTTIGIGGSMESVLQEVNAPLCRIPVEEHMPLHRGVAFVIEVPNTNISKNCTFIPGGMNGSAIENFSCVIYNVSLMNCTWQAGMDAPGDAQYGLYWRNSRDDEVVECGLYIKDEGGRHTGCVFQDVTIGTDKAYFLVNGSSEAAPIQFYDEDIQLYKVEILTPPLNVTASCTRGPAGCMITWQPPLTSHMENPECFQYELSLKNKEEPKDNQKDPPIRVRSHRYELQDYNEKKKYLLKIRARGKSCPLSSSWGEWSEPIEFGGEDNYSFSVTLFLIALGTIAVVLLQFCLFRRYGCFKGIFPPIPQPRDKFSAPTDHDVQREYVSLPPKHCTEEVSVIEETT